MPHPASSTPPPPLRGAPPRRGRSAPLHSSTVTATDTAPQPFRDAVKSMHAAHVRAEISLGDIRPPQKLAPFSHAVGLEVLHPETDLVPETSEGDAFGRLILLHDPRADETWEGTMRLVAYIQADMDADVASDPLLPQVAWQWLTEGFDECGAGFSNLGGTVTTTNSVRYGEIGGPPEAFQLEMRASWTAEDIDLAPHVEAFSRVLANVAGLPPEGVAELGR
ncbi:DUF3000 domain-containing protein [Corynebacterium freneyi]|uniref:DUF3000 domain-containing protein n=1 Tax=Corynebacterium freneyi TaxID=134034 RepID=UPI0009FFB1F4